MIEHLFPVFVYPCTSASFTLPLSQSLRFDTLDPPVASALSEAPGLCSCGPYRHRWTLHPFRSSWSQRTPLPTSLPPTIFLQTPSLDSRLFREPWGRWRCTDGGGITPTWGLRNRDLSQGPCPEIRINTIWVSFPGVTDVLNFISAVNRYSYTVWVKFERDSFLWTLFGGLYDWERSL